MANLSLNVIKDYTNDIKIKITILFKKKDESYAIYGRSLEHKICDFINNDRLFYPFLLKKGNFVKKCPVVKGFYYLINYRVPLENVPPVMQTGPVKAIFEMISPNADILIVTVYGRIEKNI